MLAQIGIKLNITNYDKIKNCSIFGNHSSTQFPNIDFASYNNKSLRELINDDNWVNKNFIEIIQKRGAEILDKRKMSSVASAASAACDHMRNWILGSENSWVSMGVYSRGEYGAPKDVIFSFPVICKDGEWKIVENLKLSEFAKEKIKVTGDELIGEKNLAFE
jgi:malate dehydrogenase